MTGAPGLLVAVVWGVALLVAAFLFGSLLGSGNVGGAVLAGIAVVLILAGGLTYWGRT